MSHIISLMSLVCFERLCNSFDFFAFWICLSGMPSLSVGMWFSYIFYFFLIVPGCGNWPAYFQLLIFMWVYFFLIFKWQRGPQSSANCVGVPLCCLGRGLTNNNNKGPLAFWGFLTQFPRSPLPLPLPVPSLPFASVVAVLLSVGSIPDRVLSGGALSWKGSWGPRAVGGPSAPPPQVEPPFSDAPSAPPTEHLRGLCGPQLTGEPALSCTLTLTGR